MWLKEDYYDVHDNLEKYHKYKKYFKIAAKDRNNPETARLLDINQIHSFEDLYRSLKIIYYYIQDDEDKEALKAAEKDAEKVYNSENYMIVVPKTQEASCAYGRGTRWCTAATGSQNYFNQYNSQGPLYIIINKKNQEKHQFHFQSEQYMDDQDDQVNLDKFFDANPELKEPLVDLALKNGAEHFAIDILPERVVQKLDELDEMDEPQLKRVVGNSAYLAVRYGIKNPEKVNAVQSLFTFEEKGVWINTQRDWTDLAEDFVASSRRGSETDTAKRVLGGDFWLDIYDAGNSYDSTYWRWLDKKSQLLIQKYIWATYNTEIRNMDEAQAVVDEKDDTYIKDLLTHAYDDAYTSSIKAKYYELAIDAITDSLGGIHKWDANGGLSFRWIANSLLNTLDSMKDHFDRQTNTDKQDFLSDYAEYQRDEDELTIPNFDNIYGNPSIKDWGEQFNQRIQSDIEIPEAPQLDLDLSSFKNYFDQRLIK